MKGYPVKKLVLSSNQVIGDPNDFVVEHLIPSSKGLATTKSTRANRT